METYEEWVEFANRPGSVSTVRELEWLLRGCPRCGCTSWQVTNDGWCYCDGCSAGFSTWGIWTNVPLAHFDEHGFHCFMCKGRGRLEAGELCDECKGLITRPI